MHGGLVIFDCDGVLVDSETISLSVTLEHLAAAGCCLTEEEGYETLLGKSSATNARWLREERGVELSDAQESALREALYSRFRAELKPIAGIAEAIRALPCRACVASSSQPNRIRLSLELTGLLPLLEPHLYSATMVENGKPAPDLFLYAAKERNTAPQDCIVIEDSPAGVRAARAAGMRVIGFTGGSHAGPAGLHDKLAKLAPDAIIADMQDLPRTIDQVINAR